MLEEKINFKDVRFIFGVQKKRKKKVIEDPILAEWRLMLKNYDFLYRTQSNRKKAGNEVLEETNVLLGIIDHPHLTQSAKRRQFVSRYCNVSRSVLEPPQHKKALRWLFKKLDSLVNFFRKKRRYSFSAYFKPTREEKLREKLEEKMYRRHRNSL